MGTTAALIVLLAIGLLLRLVLAFVIYPQEGLFADIDLFSTWSLVLADHGPGGFYASSSTVSDTPGYLYLFWLVGIVAKVAAQLTGGAAPELIPILIKLPMIVADFVVAVVIFRAVSRWQSPRAGLLAAGAYLLTPVTWYMSALWGQVDAIGFLAVALALIWLIDRRPELATSAAVVAFLIKPQFAVVLPIVGIILLRRHLFRRSGAPSHDPVNRNRVEEALERRFGDGPGRLLTSALIATVVALVLIVPFDLETRAPAGLANIPVLGDVAGLISIVITRGSSFAVLTANAFNPWALVGPQPLVTAIGGDYQWTFDTLQILGVPAVLVGVTLFLAVTVAVVALLWRRDDRYSILLASVVLATAFFVLLTRVHERYLFTAVALGAFLVPVSRKWLAWYVAATAVLLVNMHAVLSAPFAGYGTPAMRALPFAELSREPVVVAITSLASVALLAWPLWLLIRRWREPVDSTDAESTDANAVQDPTIATAAAAKTSTTGGQPAVDRPSPVTPTKSQAIDRLDWLAVLVLGLAALVIRVPGLDRPLGMYFDENLHVRTSAEFLQGWRYGMTKVTSEWTHPHLAKYAMAASINALGTPGFRVVNDFALEINNAVIEPGRVDAASGTVLYGSRIYLAAAEEIVVAALANPSQQQRIAAPATTSVALDDASGRLWVGSSDGSVRYLDTASIDFASPTAPTLQDSYKVPTAVRNLWAVGVGSVLAYDGTTLTLLRDGAVLATASLPEVTDASLIPGDGSRLAIVNSSGLHILDGSSLAELQAIAFSRRPLTMTLIDGSDFERRSRGLLAAPVLYVATRGGVIELIEGFSEESVSDTGRFTMPGEIFDLAWNPSTNLVHVLGEKDGQPTIYTVDPRGQSTFADTPLPIIPLAWGLDVRREEPAVDLQQVVAVDARGGTVSVAIGGTMFAARLPGVLLGAGTVVLVYLLARVLFRRRDVALLAGGLMLIEGLMFSQSRIATPDVYTGFFIVAAILGVALLLRPGARSDPVPTRRALVALLGIGLLLGLAASTKWTGVYAIGSVALILLIATPGWTRWVGVVLAGAGVAVLALRPLSANPPDLVFPVLAIVAVSLLAYVVRRWESSDVAWRSPLTPRQLAWGIPALVVAALATYVVLYLPYVFLEATEPQLIAGWPPDHAGETLLQLQVRMFQFHELAGETHSAGSPWWSWPLMLKPLWGYVESFTRSQATIVMAPNPAILWLSIPAIAYALIRVVRRIHPALLILLIAIAVQWLPWARIDRVSFTYHFYTALPFAVIALAYLLARLWNGPSARVWLWVRVAAIAVIALAPVVWLATGPLCAELNTNAESAMCLGTRTLQVPLGAAIWAVVWMITVVAAAIWLSGRDRLGWPESRRDRRVAAALVAVLLVASLVTGLAALAQPIDLGSPTTIALLATALAVPLVVLVLRTKQPRRFVVGVFAIAGAVAVLLYPGLAAVSVAPGLPLVYQALLPTGDVSFVFRTGTGPLLPVLAWLILPITLVAVVARYGLVALDRRSEPPQT